MSNLKRLLFLFICVLATTMLFGHNEYNNTDSALQPVGVFSENYTDEKPIKCIFVRENVSKSGNLVIVNAGEDKTICTDFVTLIASELPEGFTGLWTIVSGSGIFANPTLPTTDVTTLAYGENVFNWTITDGTETFSDAVVITCYFTDVYAGADQVVCADNAFLAASIPFFGTGTWTCLGGAATIHNPEIPNTMVSNLGVGANIFLWTVTNEDCPISDQVIIYRNGVQVDAGADQEICITTAHLLANQPQANQTGLWTLVSGAGNILYPESCVTEVTDIGFGENVFIWTITNGGCTTSDTTVITSNYYAVNAGLNQNVCVDSTFLIASIPVSGTGIWTCLGGAATIHNPENHYTTVTNLCVGANVFRWTVQGEKCTTWDEVIIFTNQPAFIVNQPSFQTLNNGENAVFTVETENEIYSYQWRKDNAEILDNERISGSTTPVLTIGNLNSDDAGYYDCHIVGHCNSIISEPVGLIITSTPEIIANADVQIYPNPTDGVFYVETDTKYEIIIFDIVGNQIVHCKTSTTKPKFDLSNYAQGSYLIKFVGNDKVFTKIIIKR